MSRSAWLSDLFSSLRCLKGGDGKREAQTQASFSALKERGASWREDTGEGAMQRLGVTRNTQIFSSGNSPGGGDRAHRITV